MKMKYVIVEQLGSCFDVPILFPSFLAHDAMIGKLGMTRSDVISAGKTWVSEGASRCQGWFDWSCCQSAGE